MLGYRIFLNSFLAIFVLNIFLNQVKADTPANCTYEDVRGAWQLFEFVKGQDKTVDCTYNCKSFLLFIFFELKVLK